MFLWLLLAQWLAATAAALWASPEPWDGLFAHLPSLAYKAFGLGAVIATLPVIVALRHPGSGLTRREIAVGQGLMTSLLIHVVGRPARDALRRVRVAAVPGHVPRCHRAAAREHDHRRRSRARLFL